MKRRGVSALDANINPIKYSGIIERWSLSDATPTQMLAVHGLNTIRQTHKTGNTSTVKNGSVVSRVRL